MKKVQILVTTMNAKNFEKYFEMNLQTDAIIANQSNESFVREAVINGNNVKLITTQSRGLSKNRNVAINHSFVEDEYIVFADDDLIFIDGYEKIIVEEFKNHPNADAIKFNLNCISKRKLSMKSISEFKRATRKSVTSSGVCGLAIKTKVIIENKLFFNERFGAGLENFCGEDTIFLKELFKLKIKLYLSPTYIADIYQDQSSWFNGYSSKYFVTAGMIINEIYPMLSSLLVIRSAYRFSKNSNVDLNFLEILKCYYKGIYKNIKEKRCEFKR